MKTKQNKKAKMLLWHYLIIPVFFSTESDTTLSDTQTLREALTPRWITGSPHRDPPCKLQALDKVALSLCAPPSSPLRQDFHCHDVRWERGEGRLERWLHGQEHLLCDHNHLLTWVPADLIAPFDFWGHQARKWYIYIHTDKIFLHIK